MPEAVTINGIEPVTAAATEVLSPAGSPAALEAAMRAGADAAYFGLGGFNARKNAENFDDGALTGAVASCHGRGVKAYLTLNTLARTDEMAAALTTAEKAAAAGIDGVIVQDLGLAALLHKAAPALPLHASTQMSVHTPAALPFLKEMGFVRVVAAREMSREELAAFCKAARELDMEVEVFVHGALCMCVSGQCLLSAVLGGRSGNRGLCAQPCRLPFQAEGSAGYDLSLKDMSLIDHIAELKAMGAASLKIEGRMKRPEYVAAATAVCRMAVDGISPPAALREALEQVFSRSGFTDGYFTGRPGPRMFGRRTEEDGRRSAAVLPLLHELTRRERQGVPVDGVFTLRAGEPARLALTDGRHTAQVAGPVPEAAVNRPLDGGTAAERLSKLGGTCFYMRDFSAAIDPGVTLPASALSALRREAAGRLLELREQVGPIPFQRPDLTLSAAPAGPDTPGLAARFADLRQMPGDLEAFGLRAVCLPVEAELAAVKLPKETELWAHLPRGLFGREDWVWERLSRAKEAGVKTALCGNLSAAGLARRAGMAVQWDIGMNLFNAYALQKAAGLGAAGAVLAAEAALADCKAILRTAPIPCGLYAYGRLPLMLTRNCPGKNRAGGADCAACGGSCQLSDRKGLRFPVMCRAGCAELYNSRPVWMADRLEELKGFSYLLLSFTTEDRETCAEVLEAYRAGGKPPAVFTRGMLYRGVE
ncbi:MAG: U32 family peptidase [Clostridiales bacterium]|nr:U32 family peptidase [Clostridiales bacterium]